MINRSIKNIDKLVNVVLILDRSWPISLPTIPAIRMIEVHKPNSENPAKIANKALLVLLCFVFRYSQPTLKRIATDIGIVRAATNKLSM